MFAQKLVSSFRKDKKVRRQRVDIVVEQVKRIMAASDQRLILMVRG